MTVARSNETRPNGQGAAGDSIPTDPVSKLAPRDIAQYQPGQQRPREQRRGGGGGRVTFAAKTRPPTNKQQYNYILCKRSYVVDIEYDKLKREPNVSVSHHY